MVPLGFGVFFDIHAGSQLMTIAGPACTLFDLDFFANFNLFLASGEQMKAVNPEMITPESILLTAETQM